MFQNTAVVPASVHVEPAPRAGDHITVTLDGAAVPNAVGSDSEFSISGVFRGAHQLAVRVEDASGQTVCQSQAVPFFVRQASVLAPNSPTRPH